MFLRQDPHALTVLAEAAGDDIQQYLAGVRYQRDSIVVAALCPILIFVEYHDDGIFLLRIVAFEILEPGKFREDNGDKNTITPLDS